MFCQDTGRSQQAKIWNCKYTANSFKCFHFYNEGPVGGKHLNLPNDLENWPEKKRSCIWLGSCPDISDFLTPPAQILRVTKLFHFQTGKLVAVAFSEGWAGQVWAFKDLTQFHLYLLPNHTFSLSLGKAPCNLELELETIQQIKG